MEILGDLLRFHSGDRARMFEGGRTRDEDMSFKGEANFRVLLV